MDWEIKKKAGRRIWNHDGDEWNKCMIVYVWMREPDGKFDQYIWNGCTRNQEDIPFVKIYHLLILKKYLGCYIF